MPCSACSISAASITRVSVSCGFWPLSMYKKFAASESDGSGAIGFWPLRNRWKRGHDRRELRRQPDRLALVRVRIVAGQVGSSAPAR
jgi:hypothetical protein